MRNLIFIVSLFLLSTFTYALPNASVTKVAFDKTEVGRGSGAISATITIKNTGDAYGTFYITGSTITDSEWYEYTPERKSITIASGDSGSVNLSWSPAADADLGVYGFYTKVFKAGTSDAFYTDDWQGDVYTVIEGTGYNIIASMIPVNGGTITGYGNYRSGETCNLIATPAVGHTFVNWTEGGNEVSTDVNYSFNIASNRTLVANFMSNGTSASVTNVVYDKSQVMVALGDITSTITIKNTGTTTETFYIAGSANIDDEWYDFPYNRASLTLASGVSGNVDITWYPNDGIKLGDYNLMVKVYLGSKDTVYISDHWEWDAFEVVDLGTGIVGIDNSSDVNVYPNPTKGKVTIEGKDIETIGVYNLSGKLIKQMNSVHANEAIINLSDQARGIYLIKTTMNGKVVSQKIHLK